MDITGTNLLMDPLWLVQGKSKLSSRQRSYSLVLQNRKMNRKNKIFNRKVYDVYAIRNYLLHLWAT